MRVKAFRNRLRETRARRKPGRSREVQPRSAPPRKAGAALTSGRASLAPTSSAPLYHELSPYTAKRVLPSRDPYPPAETNIAASQSHQITLASNSFTHSSTTIEFSQFRGREPYLPYRLHDHVSYRLPQNACHQPQRAAKTVFHSPTGGAAHHHTDP